MLRIVAGTLGGRRIEAPRGRHTRPTAEKVRAALFNALAQRIDMAGSHVVDLYAGSGALGIEAISRGAAHATFVEDDPRTAASIRANLKALNISPMRARVVQQKALAWLRREQPDGAPVQVVLLDPPYAAENTRRCLLRWRFGRSLLRTH
jgi:16S rRNA (guanine(966)-N(2))-methyltransferase RsmD